MPRPWIVAISESIPTSAQESLQDDRLNKDQMAGLEQIVDRYGLTLNRIQDELSESKDLGSSPGYLALEAIIAKIDTNTGSELTSLCRTLAASLSIPDNDWNWSTLVDHADYRTSFYYKLRTLRVLLEKCPNFSDHLSGLELCNVLSCHANPHVPWSCDVNSRIVDEITNKKQVEDMVHANFMSYIYEYAKPTFVNLSSKPESSELSLSHPKLSNAGYSSAKLSRNSKHHGGLRPKLGFSSINDNITSEDRRVNFKSSSDIRALSMAWFIISFSKGNPNFDNYWPLLTSFILNVLDDHEVLFKAQGCKLLDHFLISLEGAPKDGNALLLRTGLLELFTDSVKTCLTYLPQMTPARESLYILSAGYPVLYKLLRTDTQRRDLTRDFVDLINGTILTSVSHVQGRNGEEELRAINIFLIDQIGSVVRDHLREGILVCLSRVNYTLNQTIVNPFLTDEKDGLSLILASLRVQQDILDIFVTMNDVDASLLLASYKYDFLASWTILVQRLLKTQGDWTPIASSIRDLVKGLNRISVCASQQEELQADIREITKVDNEITKYLCI